MTDRGTDFIFTPKVDQAAYTDTLNKIDTLKARSRSLDTGLAEGRALINDILASSRLEPGEKFDERIEKASNAFTRLRTGIQNTARSMGNFVSNAIGGLTRVASIAAKVAIPAAIGSTLAFTSRFGATDPESVSVRKATKTLEAATEDLGRVLSRFLIPVFENLAAAVKIVAVGLEQLFPAGSQNPIATFFTQTIPDAAKALNGLVSVVKVAGAVIENGFSQAVDTLSSGFKIIMLNIEESFINLFNALIDAIASITPLPNLAAAIRSRKSSRTEKGRISIGVDAQGNAIYSDMNDFDLERRAGKATYDARTGQRNEDFTAKIAKIAQDYEDANDLIDALGKGAQAIKDGLSQGRIGEAEVEAFRQRREALAKSEKAYNEAVVSAKEQANRALAKLDQDRLKALERLVDEQRKAEQELTENYHRDKLKSEQDYQERENEIIAEQQLKREQDLRRHELTLSELAARGDVAGFIEEQKRYALARREEDEQSDFERERRRTEFDSANQERDEQYRVEMEKLQQSGRDKEAEIRAQYAQQEAELNASLNEQLAMLYEKHEEEKREIDRAFAEQLSSLDSNLAGLNELRNAHYQQDLADLENYLAQHGGLLRNIYGEGYRDGQGASGGASGEISGIGGILGPSGSLEQALRGGDNQRTTSILFEPGAIQNTVGDIATASMLELMASRLVQSIASGLSNGALEF